MCERKRGHLVGISSLAQYRGLPGNAMYSATKAFLSNFLESLRADLHGVEVAVTDVRPGFVNTPMTDAATGPHPFLMRAIERRISSCARSASAARSSRFRGNSPPSAVVAAASAEL